jgi:hypothetical protein
MKRQVTVKECNFLATEQLSAPFLDAPNRYVNPGFEIEASV